MTEKGCVQCPEDTFSGPGADVCEPCPDEWTALAGSTDPADCSPPTSKITVAILVVSHQSFQLETLSSKQFSCL